MFNTEVIITDNAVLGPPFLMATRAMQRSRPQLYKSWIALSIIWTTGANCLHGKSSTTVLSYCETLSIGQVPGIEPATSCSAVKRCTDWTSAAAWTNASEVIRSPGNFCLWNLKSWALESGIQLKRSGIPQTTRIRNLSSTDKESGIQYLDSGIHSVESKNPRLSWIPLHEAIPRLRRMESFV